MDDGCSVMCDVVLLIDVCESNLVECVSGGTRVNGHSGFDIDKHCMDFGFVSTSQVLIFIVTAA